MAQNLSDLYDIASRGNIRGKASQGFVRPTIGQFFMSDRDFEEVDTSQYNTEDELLNDSSAMLTIANDDTASNQIFTDSELTYQVFSKSTSLSQFFEEEYDIFDVYDGYLHALHSGNAWRRTRFLVDFSQVTTIKIEIENIPSSGDDSYSFYTDHDGIRGTQRLCGDYNICEGQGRKWLTLDVSHISNQSRFYFHSGAYSGGHGSDIYCIYFE